MLEPHHSPIVSNNIHQQHLLQAAQDSCSTRNQNTIIRHDLVTELWIHKAVKKIAKQQPWAKDTIPLPFEFFQETMGVIDVCCSHVILWKERGAARCFGVS